MQREEWKKEGEEREDAIKRKEEGRGGEGEEGEEEEGG